MNNLLEYYRVDVEFPEVSGAELIEMLQTRDKLAKIEATLSQTEKEVLAQADYLLIRQAPLFHQSLSDFVDFVERRKAQDMPIEHWWWSLDVLAQLPFEQLVAVRQAPTGTKHHSEALVSV